MAGAVLSVLIHTQHATRTAHTQPTASSHRVRGIRKCRGRDGLYLKPLMKKATYRHPVSELHSGKNKQGA